MHTHKKYISFLNTFTFRQWVLFYMGLGLVLVSLLSFLYTAAKNSQTTIPVSGGTYTEGIVGNIRSINPVLAVTEIEKEVTNLVFRGLFGKDENGEIFPLLADSYTVSEDGLTYTIILKDEIYFHDKKPVTAQDVEFTVKQIKDPTIKSPRQAAFSGVDIKVIDDKTIEFKLKQRYADFLDTLTVGILSKEEWKDVTTEQFALTEKNMSPIGAGPYAFESLKENKGIPQKITFTRNKRYIEGKPYIKKIDLTFFSTEKEALNALNTKEIGTLTGVTPENISIVKDNLTIEKAVSPRLFGLFFNTNTEPIFQDHSVIEALEYAINKPEIIETVFNGYAVQKDSAVPFIESEAYKPYDVEKAAEILSKKGWEKNTEGIWEKNGTPLKFTITTTDIDELKLVNVLIQQQLETFGAQVLIKTYETTTFSQEVLNARNYQVVLFGQAVNKPSNLYAFWHSNERNAPGLNITMYVNQRVDTLLDRIKKELDTEAQTENLQALDAELEKDKPAIVLYQPMSISVSSREIFNRKYNTSLQTSRFFNVHLWSTKTDHVWKLFTK